MQLINTMPTPKTNPNLNLSKPKETILPKCALLTLFPQKFGGRPVYGCDGQVSTCVQPYRVALLLIHSAAAAADLS